MRPFYHTKWADVNISLWVYLYFLIYAILALPYTETENDMKIKIYDVCNDYSLSEKAVFEDTSIDYITEWMTTILNCRILQFLPDTQNPVKIKGYNLYDELVYQANIFK